MDSNLNMSMKSSLNCTVVLDQNGKVVDTSIDFCKIFGDFHEMVGTQFSKYLSDPSQTRILSWLKMVRVGSKNVQLIRVRQNQTSSVEMSMSGVYLRHSETYVCHLSQLETYSMKDYMLKNIVEEDSKDMFQLMNQELFQSLMDEFYALTGIPIGIIDLKGNILVAEGWQDICTKFHRIHPEACANCHVSDIELTKGLKQGEIREYKCKNNMWDVATPIYISGIKRGHIFLGQFFYDDEDVDMDFFTKQASQYGFDQEAYLEALNKVPRFSKETINSAMQFYAKLADLVAELSFANARLSESIQVLKDKVSFEQILMDSIPSPVFYKDANRIFRGGNKAFDEAMGDPDKSYIGKDIYALTTKERADLYNAADLSLLENSGEKTYDASVQYADGIVRDVLFHMATFSDAYGRTAGIIGVMLDITNRKKIEKELIAARDNLEYQVEERTSELTATNEELVALNEELSDTLDSLREAQQQLILAEKMAALGSLVAGISHEISTPLGISVTSVSYVEHELVKIEKKYRDKRMMKQEFETFIRDAKSMMNTAVKSLERAHHLLNSFKVIAIDQTSNEWRSFDALSYMKDIIVSLDPILKSKNCEVDLACPEAMQIKGYPGAFAQIITNLVNNSIIHGFENKETGHIQISIEKINGRNHLNYYDNGEGMSTEVKNRAFEPFYTTKRGSQGGTGLGLHLVYNLVTQKLGGQIELKSEKNKGVHIEIVFPDIIPETYLNG